ncbi:hypothetical protein [Mucilaginibacter ginsenosidivorans]|uniref:UDP-N-acetyl glucosamine 2-epimerase n=1 Tax=Mucilaginibacter ginsenosidivorans TaxID=398053 RepID=A0A5B8V2N6_9SPHI|nr:hypothetical protein [Mucilaginibacter ginsenosidivorans]QEC65428.1 hypothetical protein FRZ54_23610 [Mucilaginibacter ginsenosidivorans]
MRKKILFITGSLNQTSQMHQIASLLPDYDCWFSQIFSDAATAKFFEKHTSVIESTVMARRHRESTEKYLRAFGCQIDYKAVKNEYSLVVFCSDMVVPANLRQTKKIWVQEGMIDKMTIASHIVKFFGLPIWMAGNTSLNGSTNLCDIYCAASEGYKTALSERGADENRIIVTGIPNYDNLELFADNDFPHRDYVMVATTDLRETFRFENRPAFIRKAVKMANGKRLLFKLHPNENFARAEAEIRRYAPSDALIYHHGNTNEMIANCCELITQYSTVVYTGIALRKKVHSWFDTESLYRQMPIQNQGTSAENIAGICRSYIEFEGKGDKFLKNFIYRPVDPRPVVEELIAS